MKTQNILLYTIFFFGIILFTNCSNDDDETGGEVELPNYQNSCCDIPPLTGCIGGAKFYVPNAFTPNGDGINDIFFPLVGQGIQEITTLVIKSQDNTTVFSEDNLVSTNDGWDGRVAGATPVEGVYNYTITVMNVAGESATFDGSICSRINVPFSCVDNEKQCTYPIQFNGEGGFDASVSTLETDCQ